MVAADAALVNLSHLDHRAHYRSARHVGAAVPWVLCHSLGLDVAGVDCAVDRSRTCRTRCEAAGQAAIELLREKAIALTPCLSLVVLALSISGSDANEATRTLRDGCLWCDGSTSTRVSDVT